MIAISLNARKPSPTSVTPKTLTFPSLGRWSLYVCQAYLNVEPGSLYLYFSLYFLLVWNLNFSQRWEHRAFSYLLGYVLGTGHVCCVLNSLEYAGIFKALTAQNIFFSTLSLQAYSFSTCIVCATHRLNTGLIVDCFIAICGLSPQQDGVYLGYFVNVWIKNWNFFLTFYIRHFSTVREGTNSQVSDPGSGFCL